MTSQNGSPGQPNNANLDRPGQPAAPDDKHARDRRQMGLDHIDELEPEATPPETK